MTGTLRWGIISTGRIAAAFARALPHSETGTALAVASRHIDSARAFAEEHSIARTYGSYDELLADEEVDAVYIATPHPFHAKWSIRAADAGKHILCEKPIALNFNDAQAIVEAAVRNDVFLMEAFMYRCNPQTIKLCELLKEKAIGEVRLVRATFSFNAGRNTDSRLLNNALGGGGILDVGCYTTSMARLVAGVALGKRYVEPIDVKGVGHVNDDCGTDEWAAAVLRFPNDIIGQCATGVQLAQNADVVIYGSEGKITITSPWFGTGREGGTTEILVECHGEDPRPISVTGGWLYAIEADLVARNIENRQGAWPAMEWEDTLENMRTLDRWREEVGVVYEGETPEAYATPLDGKPVVVRPNPRVGYQEIQGLDKKVSSLALGSMPYPTVARAAVAYDEFFARGGNCVDTAYIYAGGACEKALGAWMASRGVRDEMALIVKGAHTPHDNPEAIEAQLDASLERLQTDRADIYFLHRDNTDIPAGEWVDALDALAKDGRIGVFGGSNWTRERIEEANAYASEHGKQGFSALSNNFSLARMLDPVWTGCIASSESDFRRWHETTGFPLFSWSSQAQGFFVPGRAAPDKTDDPNLVRCWYSDENFERRRRVYELAEKRGCSPIAISLAYVLCQPFPTFALIGPHTLAEMRTSFDALDIELTPEDIAWLDLRDG